MVKLNQVEVEKEQIKEETKNPKAEDEFTVEKSPKMGNGLQGSFDASEIKRLVQEESAESSNILRRALKKLEKTQSDQ